MKEKILAFARNFIRIYMTKLLVLVIGFINSVIIARTLGVNGQGQYALALTIYSIGFQIVNMGLHSAHSYYLATDKKNLSVVYGNSLGISIVSLCLCIIAIIVIFVAKIDVGIPNNLVFITLLIIPCYLFYYLHYQTMLVMEKIKVLNITDIIMASFPLIGNVVLIECNYISVKTVLLTLLISYLIADIIGILYFVYLKIMPKVSFSFYLKCIRLGIVASVACFLGYLVLRVDILMVQNMIGTENTGYYSLSENLVEIVNSFGATCTLVMFPKAAAIEDRHERFLFTRNILKMVLCCMIVILILGELLGGLLITKVYGANFSLSIPSFRVLLIGIVLWGLAGVPISYYTTEKKYGLSLASYLVAFFCNIVLNFFWIPKYGINGAAWASTVSYFVVAVITMSFYLIKE